MSQIDYEMASDVYEAFESDDNYKGCLNCEHIMSPLDSIICKKCKGGSNWEEMRD